MSQRPVTGPEDLTPLQRRYLRNLRDYCESPPTLAVIYAKTWRNTLGLFLLAGIGIGVGILLARPAVSWLCGAFISGALVRDLGYFRRTVQLWPTTRAILDRERLEELIADPPGDNYS